MRMLLRTQPQNLQIVKRVDRGLDVPRIGLDLLARVPQPIGGSGESRSRAQREHAGRIDEDPCAALLQV